LHNPFPKIKFNNTSTKEIERIIKFIKVKNLHGYDGITTKMLKIGAPYISSPINYICNTSIRPGTFPTHLKYYVVNHYLRKVTGKTSGLESRKYGHKDPSR
jgi:hypothetical protein